MAKPQQELEMFNKKRFLMGIPGIFLVFMMVFLMGCPDPDDGEGDDTGIPEGAVAVTLATLHLDGDLPFVGGASAADGTQDATKKVVLKCTNADTGAGTIQWAEVANAAQNVTFKVEKSGFQLRITYEDETPEEVFPCWFDGDTGALKFIKNALTYNLPPKTSTGGGRP
jgi:hypothetical protein